jgi:excisionase family DNA binding protein
MKHIPGVACNTEHIEWLSTAEAACRLGVTIQGVYQLIDAGQLTGYRFGRGIRLRVEDVKRRRDDARPGPRRACT